MSRTIANWTGLVFLAFAIMLGGASAPGAGALANAVLQTFALGAILYALWTRRAPYPGEAKLLFWLGGLFLAAALAQLVPLPAGVWENLPGRARFADNLALMGVEGAAMPLSLAPQAGMAGLLGLLPPAAMFLLVLAMPVTARQRLAWAVLGIATLSLILGAGQLAGGPQSPARFYAITNPNSPVGFFANTNNLAMLLLCAMPFAGYLAARALRRGRSAKRRSGVMLGVAVALFLALGVGVVGSLAGYGLLLPVAAATLLIYRRAAYGPLPLVWTVGLGVLVIGLLGFALFGPFGEQALGADDVEHPTNRLSIAATTLHAIGQYMPWGTGLGSFPEIYRLTEGADRPYAEYVNHAHNDYLELLLELGVVGGILILAFLVWYAIRLFDVWRREFEGVGLARVATVIIAVLLLHSIVEFPLRTSALAVLFAMACALLVPAPPERDARRRDRPSAGLRHLEAD